MCLHINEMKGRNIGGYKYEQCLFWSIYWTVLTQVNGGHFFRNIFVDKSNAERK